MSAEVLRAMKPTPGRIIGQKLRLERPLASGGMGMVWAARHLLLDTPVAVKFVQASITDTESARVRFEREAKAAAQLRSPNVVQILDYGVDDGTPYMVMEMLVGEDLRGRLERRGRLSIREVAVIVGEIAKGLKLAHEAGIVHRDLKPSNVFLARAGDDEVAKILDFGVAKQIGSGSHVDETATGVLVGSPTYMSPEQARGGPIGPRSDLWSLGVIAFHALTGERPFAGEHAGDVLVRICTDEPPIASRLAPDLPTAVDAFFERALCKSPDGRFPTARAMADELAALATAHPHDAVISLAPPPRPSSEGPSGVAARSDETASLGVALDAGARSIPRGGPPEAGASAGSVDDASDEAVPPARGRTWPWAIAAVFVVAGGWLLWQSPLMRRGEAASQGPEASADPSPAAPAPAPSPTVVPVVVAASAAPSATSPEASATAPPAVQPTRPRTFAPVKRPPAPRGTATAAAQVDPKFGLPVKPP